MPGIDVALDRALELRRRVRIEEPVERQHRQIAFIRACDGKRICHCAGS
jgi:hypothetical protein